MIFSRHLKGSEFLDRIEKWHNTGIWRHAYRKREAKGKITPFFGVPSLEDIVESMYGKNAGTKMKSAVIERIISCIVDGRGLPRDIFQSIYNRIKEEKCTK